MSSLTNKSTRVDTALQQELAAYGLLRMEALEEAPPNPDNPEFFGIKRYGDTTEFKFDSSISAIQDDSMTVALAAPELESFNMLATTNFDRAKDIGTKDEIRAFLRRIVNEA